MYENDFRNTVSKSDWFYSVTIISRRFEVSDMRQVNHSKLVVIYFYFFFFFHFCIFIENNLCIVLAI